MQTDKLKRAKRKLTDITFDHEGAHIALVNASQGHGANNHHYTLLMKNQNFSQEFIEKASQVKVTMPIEQFLSRFFGMYSEQAEVLARALGFKTVAMDKQELEAKEDMLEEKEQEIDPEMPEEQESKEYEDWIQSQLEAFEIMKSMQESDSMIDLMSKLDEDDYLALLNDQALIEKAFRKLERAEKALLKKQKESTVIAPEAPADEPSVTVGVVEVETSVVNKANKETNMTQEVQVEQVEMVEKSQLEQLLKAQADMQVELQKARDLLSVYEQEKKDAIAKARKQELTAAVKQADVAEVLFKAVKDAADEDFAAVVKALADMQAVVEKSAMFEEQGASVQEDQEVVQESAVARLIKAKMQKA
jgi:hypothetical protein